MYSTTKEHPIRFVKAFDKLQEQRRKLFGMPEIDNILNFSDNKNICIVNKSFRNKNNFLYSLFAQFCIDYYYFSNEGNSNKENKTILIDAGSGNNIGYIYLDLAKKSIKNGFNINKILDNITISRAFTFYQLANIIINELPNVIDKIDCKKQIIVMDLLETLLPSFSSMNKNIKTTNNDKDNNNCKLKEDFDSNINILNEIIDNLINISDKHFVIVYYNDINNLAKRSIFSKFKNIVEINEQNNFVKGIIENENENEKLLIKIKSINNNTQKPFVYSNNVLH
jgi:hypothetical protein